ncbi:hypothetical protein [Euzebya sp.]|uniref:hypothetical protein n=1 Tax=Euzebya sp. TaxID=1971409 RepID=UPI003512722C
MGPSPRVRLAAGVLWTVVALGPVLGAVALISSATAPGSAVADDGVPVGVEGVAELAVAVHLRAPAGEPAWRPAVAAPTPAEVLEGLTTAQQIAAARAAAAPLGQISAVAARPAGRGRWGVVVGVARDRGVERWQVTVAEVDGDLVVETLPALVGPGPGSRLATPPAVSPLRPPSDDEVAVTTAGFLAAWLGTAGDVDRYVAAVADVPAGPPAVADVELRRIASGAVDDRHVAVLAEVLVVRDDGAVALMHYPLLLRRADARWQVAQLLPALPLRAPAPPTPPTDTTPPTGER